MRFADHRHERAPPLERVGALRLPQARALIEMDRRLAIAALRDELRRQIVAVDPLEIRNVLRVMAVLLEKIGRHIRAMLLRAHPTRTLRESCH
jgi:hypothetical protein